MSFFNDFLDSFSSELHSKKVVFTFVFDVGLMVVGDVRLKDVTADLIQIISGYNEFFVYGHDLVIKSIAKGEMLISGKITKIEKV